MAHINQLGDSSKELQTLSLDVKQKEAQNTSGVPAVAGGYGAAIVEAFIEIQKYLGEMSKQGFELQQTQAQSLIGSNGNKGMIQSWLDAGMNAADASGKQVMDQAWQSLSGAIVGGLAGVGMGVGYHFNCSPFNAARKEMQEGLGEAQNYKNLLSEGKSPDVVIGEQDDLNGIDDGIVKRMKEMEKGINIEKFNPNHSQYEETVQAAKHMRLNEDQHKETIKHADKQIERYQNQLNEGYQTQNTFTNYVKTGQECFSALGSGVAGSYASKDSVESGREKAGAEVMQTSISTTTDTQGKASQTAQSNRELMAQMAQSMASALNSQVRG